MLIPEPKFYLKDINSNIPTLIYLQAKYTHVIQQRVMLSTGDKILPTDWDYTKQRALISKKNLGNADINLWLDKMVNTFKSVFRNYLIDGIIPTATMMKEKLEEALNLKTCLTKQQKEVSFYDFIETFITESKSFKALGTVKAYRSTFNRIKEYGRYCNKEFSFEDISLEWRTGFIKYLQSLGTGKNTEGKYIKDIKTFLNEATERGLNKNLAFKSKSFSKPGEDVHKIFLTKDEIQKIADLDLSEDKQQEITRDYFVIGCLTSLRYSDLVRIKSEHIKDNCLQMITIKTNNQVIIPIAPLVQKILQKYNYDLPKAPCNQLFNRYLKEIGKKAELNENVHVTRTVGGIKKTIIEPKWKFLSSHVGRRSLVSNCILEGINTSSIMLISGHKSLKVFQGYVRINQHQNAEALLQHKFFKNERLKDI
jgi:integrase